MPKSTQTCFIVALIVFGLAAGCNVAYAQEPPTAETIIKEETVTTQDLGIAEPTLLPSSSFYFLKNWTRGIQRALTFSPVKKVELELRHADEKIAEAKKLAEQNPESTEAIAAAIENYRTSQERLKARLGALTETSQNPNVDKLLEKLADRAVKHEKLFAELKEKFEDQKEFGKKIDAIKEKIEENLTKAAEKDDPKKFAKRMEKALVESRGSDLKHVRSLEILDRINQKAPEELKKEISAIREDFSKRLKEDLEEFVKKHEKAAPKILEETFRDLPGDKTRRLVIIEELQERADKRVRDALKASENILEKVFQEKEELAERTQEAVRHAEERLQKLGKEMKAVASPPPAAERLLKEALLHLDEAKSAYENKKYGEAFGQARSAEVLARNALRMLEEREEPEDENLTEDIAELEERLNGWGKRMESLSEELRPKAKEAFENSQLHLRLARENLEKDALREAKKHYEEAKKFERLLERIFKESVKQKGDRVPAAAASSLPAPTTERPKEERKETAAEPQIVCTQKYDPVCAEVSLGVSKDVYRTYSNGCFARAANARVVYAGECGVKDKIWGDPAGENGIRIAPPPTTESKEPADAPPPATGSMETTPHVETMSLKIEADDNGFYPQNSLTVSKGAKVSLTFVVRKEGVYYGGLDFRSSKFKTETVKPGETTSTEFTADETFKITSYWPLTDTPKAVLTIEVK